MAGKESVFVFAIESALFYIPFSIDFIYDSILYKRINEGFNLIYCTCDEYSHRFVRTSIMFR